MLLRFMAVWKVTCPGAYATATLSPTVTGLLTSGTTLNLNLASLWQSASLTFEAAAGQTFALAVTGITPTPSGTYYGFDGLNPAMVATSQIMAGTTPDETYAQISSWGTTSFLRDGLNSTAALTNSSAAITRNDLYSPYGDSAGSGAGSTPFQYTGRENDGATGLYYYRARYYAPQLGRFVSEDPIGLGGGTNYYAYTKGNPIDNVDPLGLWTLQFGLTYSYTIWGFSGIVSAGVAIDGCGNLGTYTEYGGGPGAGTNFAGGGSVHWSTATNITELNGPFSNVSVGGGWGLNVTGDHFYGYGSNGQPVYGTGITIGDGVGTAASTRITNTNVTPVPGIPRAGSATR